MELPIPPRNAPEAAEEVRHRHAATGEGRFFRDVLDDVVGSDAGSLGSKAPVHPAVEDDTYVGSRSNGAYSTVN
jgi:hypothetical protein